MCRIRQGVTSTEHCVLVTAKQERKVQVFWKHLLRAPQLCFHCPCILSCSLSLLCAGSAEPGRLLGVGGELDLCPLGEGERREPLPRSGGPDTSFSSGATKPRDFIFSHHQVSFYLSLLHWDEFLLRNIRHLE